MTLIYSYRAPSKDQFRGVGVVIGGDTLVTTSQIYNEIHAQGAPVGVTSQNQVYFPHIDEHGYLNTYAEAACKIGRLNDTTLVAACGNADLIRTILKVYYERPDDIKTYSDFYPKFTDHLCMSLSPLPHFDEFTRAEFIFALYDKGWVTFIDMRYVIDDKNNLLHNGKYWFPSFDRPACFKGSGHSLFADFSGSFHFNADELCKSHTIQQATAFEVSNHISKKTHSDARTGIGGAILTYYLDDKGIRPPEDTIYIYANKENTLTIISKVCFRDRYFYLIDFIEKKVTGFAPLELQIAGIQQESDEYVQDLMKDISGFNAKWLFLTRELDDTADKKYEIVVQGNQEGRVIQSGDDQELLFKDLKKGKLKLNFKNDDEERELEFKIRI